MVVPVPDSHVEDHPAEQLRQVRCCLSAIAVRTEELRQLEVACAFAVLLTKQGHGRRVEPSRTLDTVKALDAEGMKIVVQPDQPGGRNVDARFYCQTVHHVFPRGYIPVIVTRRELANPKRAVGLGEVRLWPGTSERCTGCNQHRQPLAQRIQVVNAATAELIGDRLKLTQCGDRGRRQLVITQELLSAGKAKAQCTLARQVLDTNQKVPSVERTRGTIRVFGLQRLAAFHQRLTPPVWRRVQKYAKVAQLRFRKKRMFVQ